MEQLAKAAGLVLLALIGSGACFVGAVVFALCGLDDAESCAGYTGPLGIALLLVAIVLFLATSPAAGLQIRRWWAWLTPVWLLVLWQLVLLVSQVIGRI